MLLCFKPPCVRLRCVSCTIKQWWWWWWWAYQRSYSTSCPVSTGMGDRRAGTSRRYATIHSGHFSLLPSVARETIIGQSAVIFCGWRVKTGMTLMLVAFMDKRVGAR